YDFENRLLNNDVRHFPEVHSSFTEETREHLAPELRQRERESWRHADLILCASSFTRRTLIEAGAKPEICKVIPYGIETRALSTELGGKNANGFRALFIGSGVQRKGLLHLLHAWQRAHLPDGSELTLICRYLDPGLEPLA